MAMNREQVNEHLFSLVEQEAMALQDRIVNRCLKCSGTRAAVDPKTLRVTGECPCGARFMYALRLLTGNIPRSRWKDGDVDEKTVLEVLDFEGGKKDDKGSRLHAAFVDPYCANPAKVMRHGYSFVLLGEHDTGKTFTLFHILRKFARAGWQPYYTTLRQLLVHLNQIYSDQRSQTLVDAVRNVDILAIDELGKESRVSPHLLGELEDLFKHRATLCLPTVQASNKGVEEFVRSYGENITSALIETYRVLLFPRTVSFRRRYKKKWDL